MGNDFLSTLFRLWFGILSGVIASSKRRRRNRSQGGEMIEIGPHLHDALVAFAIALVACAVLWVIAQLAKYL